MPFDHENSILYDDDKHFGHVMVLNSLTGRDLDPDLDHTLTGDGLAQNHCRIFPELLGDILW